MGIPKSVWGSIPNQVAPHTGLGILPIWGATYIYDDLAPWYVVKWHMSAPLGRYTRGEGGF